MAPTHNNLTHLQVIAFSLIEYLDTCQLCNLLFSQTYFPFLFHSVVQSLPQSCFVVQSRFCLIAVCPVIQYHQLGTTEFSDHNYSLSPSPSLSQLHHLSLYLRKCCTDKICPRTGRYGNNKKARKEC